MDAEGVDRYAELEYNGYVFHVGDRVVLNDPKSPREMPANGSLGTIKKVTTERIAVEWDEPFDAGHTCAGLSEPSHGRYYVVFNGRENREQHQWIGTIVPIESEEGEEIEETDDLLSFINSFSL